MRDVSRQELLEAEGRMQITEASSENDGRVNRAVFEASNQWIGCDR